VRTRLSLIASGACCAAILLVVSCSGVRVGVGVAGGRGTGGGTYVGAGAGVSVPLTDELRPVAARLLVGSARKLPQRKELYQRSPAMAYGQGTHLMVWQEGWHGVGGKSDILAVRLNEKGRRIDRKPIVICSAPNAQTSPDVAFSDGKFLVSWSDFRNGGDYDIYATLVDLEGKVATQGGFKLAGGKGGQVHPAVASDRAGKFLVVWQDYASGKFFDIRGLRVSAQSGKPLDATAGVCLPRGEMPDVVWTGKNWFICQKWYGALLGADGKVTMASRRLWRTRSIHHPAATVAWGRAQMFFNTEPRHDPWGWGGGGAIIGVSVASDGKCPEGDAMGGKRVSDSAKADGRIRNCLDAARWRSHAGWPSGMPGGFKSTREGTWPSGRVAAAWNGRSILVAWNRAHIADKSRLKNRDLYLRRVTRDWTYPERHKIAIAAGPTDEINPELSAGKPGYALLAYEMVNPRGGIEIRYRLVLEKEDTAGPRAVYIRRWSDTSMSVVFDEPVDPDSAAVAANFKIEGVEIKSAKFDEEKRLLGREVRLETSALERGKKYVLRVANVKDKSERANAADGKAALKFVAKPGASFKGEFVEKWAIVGPFAHSWETGFVDVRKARPSPGDVVKAKDAGELKWLAVEAKRGVILPISKHFGGKKMATAYANTYCYSPEWRDVLLRVDHTDGCRIWLNGRQIFFGGKDMQGRVMHAETLEVKVRLKKGWNQLLMQSSNKMGRWRATVQLTDRRRRPLRDLTWQLENPFKK
jgi:hypothetical protein